MLSTVVSRGNQPLGNEAATTKTNFFPILTDSGRSDPHHPGEGVSCLLSLLNLSLIVLCQFGGNGSPDDSISAFGRFHCLWYLHI